MAKKKLTKKQEDLVERLRDIGVDRPVALTLVYVAGTDECIRTDVEGATGLKQPEVSIATMYLRDEGWIDKTERKKEGKGRPVHVYSLSKPVGEVFGDILEKERARISDREENLKKIEDVVKEIY